MAPIAIAAAYFGGWAFAVFWAAASIAIVWEWQSLVLRDNHRRAFVIGALTMVFAALSVELRHPIWAMTIIAVGALVVGGTASAGWRLWSGAGLVYAGVIAVAPAVVRGHAELGFVAILFLFAIVWGTDIVAYFVGRSVGGPKLWPAVSPNKTWSGGIGGCVAAVVCGMAVTSFAGLALSPALAAVCVVLSVCAQGGDLFESAVKRHFGAKDAGHLIPGHGGVMDRLDGFLTASAAAALIGLVRGGFDAPAYGLLAW